jgi:two-component system, OmpR family, alkaline phosphatase synthesis response regulator PhoP
MVAKVLIADDEAYIRLLIEQTLEKFEDQGLEILIAENGEKALSLIQSEKPGLVFLDVMMPKMNGFDVCAAVKHELKMLDVYIVMLTAKGQEFDRLQGEQAGANHYMTKPFNPDELIALTAQVLAF